MPDQTRDAQHMSTGEIAHRAAVATVVVLLIIALALVLNEIRTVLLWLVIGIVLAVGLDPVVSYLSRHRWNRTLASVLVSVLVIAIILGAIAALVIPLVEQTSRLITNLPDYVDQAFGPGGSLHFVQERVDVVAALKQITPHSVLSLLAGSQRTIVGVLGRVSSFVAGFVTVFTIMVMLLIEGPRAWKAILDMLVEDERAWATRIGDNFLRAVGGYVRGNLFISLIAGSASYVMLRIIDAPYPETLAVLVGLLDIVPLVGATIAAVIVVIVGFAAGGVGDGIALIVFFVVYQQFENNVLQNVVYAKTVALSPLVVFIAALIGAALGGIVGVLLAIPLASALWVLGRDLIQMRRERKQKAEARGEAAVLPPPPGTLGDEKA